MNKKILIVGVIITLLTIGLSGCNEQTSTENKFVGTWIYEGSEELYTDSFIFYDNGSVNCIYHYPGSTNLLHQWNNYTMVENELKIGESVYEYKFSNDDKTLTLIMVTTNTSFVYIKQ